MFNYFLMTECWQVRPLCDIDGKVILDKQRLLLDTYDKISLISFFWLVDPSRD